MFIFNEIHPNKEQYFYGYIAIRNFKLIISVPGEAMVYLVCYYSCSEKTAITK